MRGGALMKRWTERNRGSIIVEITDGKVTDLGVVGGIPEMSASVAILIENMAKSSNTNGKEIIDCIATILEK